MILGSGDPDRLCPSLAPDLPYWAEYKKESLRLDLGPALAARVLGWVGP